MSDESFTVSLCLECGPNVAVDEDGCCGCGDQLTREKQKCSHGLYFGSTCEACEVERLQADHVKTVKMWQEQYDRTKELEAENARLDKLLTLKHAEWWRTVKERNAAQAESKRLREAMQSVLEASNQPEVNDIARAALEGK